LNIWKPSARQLLSWRLDHLGNGEEMDCAPQLGQVYTNNV
jgi:hypothetical protein